MSANKTNATETASPAAPMSQRVAKSAVWAMAANAARIASAILILPILTRLLSPEDFGLMQIAAPFLFFVMVFADLGMQPALVVAEKPSKALWSTAFWSGLGLAALLTLALILAAPLIALFFDEPRAIPILQVLAVTILIGGFAIVPAAQLMRAMDFRTLAMIECASVIAGILAALFCAYQGMGVWSLVFQQLVMFTIKSTSLFVYSRPPVRLTFSVSELKSIIGVSWQLTNVRMVTLLTRSIDLIIIGRFLGAASLGFYSIAWRIVMMPIEILANGMTQVLLPAVGQIKDEPARIRNGVLRTYRTISLLSFPAIAGISSLSYPVTNIVFGEAYMPAALPISTLAMLGAIQSLLCIQGPVFLALGRVDLMLRWSLITAAAVAIFLLVGVRWGLEGAVIGSLAAGVICGIPNLQALLKLFDARLIDAWAAVRTPALLSLAMGLIVFTMSSVLLAGWSHLDKLVVCIPAGVVLYIGGLLLFDREALKDVLKLCGSVLSKAPA